MTRSRFAIIALLATIAAPACGGDDLGLKGFTIGPKASVPLALCRLVDNANGSATVTCLGGLSITLRNGTRCTVADLGGGAHSLSCDDGTGVTILDGKDGKDGSSCSVADGGNGTKTIACSDGTSAVVQDGKDGKSCTVIDSSNGTKTIACSDGTSVVLSDGKAGKDGVSSLVQTQAEPPGALCPQGGILVMTGLDSDGDGVLDPGEVVQTSSICHGASGADGASALVQTQPLPAGSGCPTGGFSIQTGIDLDHDGVLDPGELKQSIQLCHGLNGTDGADGKDTLVQTRSEPPGARCAAGGVAILAGLDGNDNGVLDAAEVAQMVYLCHGAAGSSCTVSDNGNGTKTIACSDGTSATVSDGADGKDGLSSLVRLDDEPAGANCAAGGVAIRTGLDSNGDGLLSKDEVTQTQYVCNPAPAGSAPTLVADLNPGSASSNPRLLTEVDGTLYFVADAPSEKLWKRDPVMGVSSMATTSPLSEISNLTAAGKTLYFTANYDELWRSDPNGTRRVPNARVSPPSNLVHFDGKLYFGGMNASNDYVLCNADSKDAVTCAPSGSPNSPRDLIVAGNTLYFVAGSSSYLAIPGGAIGCGSS